MLFQSKFSLLYMLIILPIILSAAPSYAQTPKPTELVILNWAEYINEDLVKAFEKEYNANIKNKYFESDDARSEILLNTDGKGVDLILANGASISNYRKKGWLQPIPAEKLNNFKYIDKRWIDSFDSAVGYSVPYFWGTTGIAYREDLVSAPITSWMQFFNPSVELKGKILAVKSSRDIIGMALKALGYSANSEDSKELYEAESLLISFKPSIARFGYINLDERSSLVRGDIAATMIYGGDALNVAEFNENIKYVIPKEGGNIWVDFFVISSQSKNIDLALKFLDFINRPKWAALNAEDMYLATPNNAAKKLLSTEIINNNVIYPDEQSLINSEFYKDLKPRALRKRALIFSRIVE